MGGAGVGRGQRRGWEWVRGRGWGTGWGPGRGPGVEPGEGRGWGRGWSQGRGWGGAGRGAGGELEVRPGEGLGVALGAKA